MATVVKGAEEKDWKNLSDWGSVNYILGGYGIVKLPSLNFQGPIFGLKKKPNDESVLGDCDCWGFFPAYVMRLFDVALGKKVTKDVSLACFQPHQSHRYLPPHCWLTNPASFTHIFTCKILFKVLISDC